MMDHQNTGTTPLLLAARNNHLALVQYLLHNGAVPDTKNCEGWAAVHLAAAAGHLDIVKQLLDFGAAHDTEAPCIQMASVVTVPEETNLAPEDAAPTTVTPLKLAIDGGHLEVALALRNAYLSPDSVQGCAHKLIGRSMSCNLVSDNGRWSVIRGFVLYMAIFFIFCAVTVEMSVTLVIMWYLFGKVLHSAERVPNAKQILGGEPMGVFFGATLSCYVLWVLELQEQLEPGILTACFWPLNGLMAISYGKAHMLHLVSVCMYRFIPLTQCLSSLCFSHPPVPAICLSHVFALYFLSANLSGSSSSPVSLLSSSSPSSFSSPSLSLPPARSSPSSPLSPLSPSSFSSFSSPSSSSSFASSPLASHSVPLRIHLYCGSWQSSYRRSHRGSLLRALDRVATNP